MIKPDWEKHEGAQGKGLRIKGRESLPVYPLPIPKQSCAYTQITECLYPNSNVLPDDARIKVTRGQARCEHNVTRVTRGQARCEHATFSLILILVEDLVSDDSILIFN